MKLYIDLSNPIPNEWTVPGADSHLYCIGLSIFNTRYNRNLLNHPLFRFLILFYQLIRNLFLYYIHLNNIILNILLT